MNDKERLDRILHELRTAQSAPGMEARVLRRMAAERERGGRWRWMTASGSGRARAVCVLGMAACVGGALVLSPMLLSRMERGRGPLQGFRTVETGSGSDRWLQDGAGVRLPMVGHAAAGTPGLAPRPGQVRVEPRAARFVKVAGGVTLPTVADAPEASGAGLPDAAFVASFPAPAMPLTRQERLLLRMLRMLRGGATGELVATLAPGAERAVRLAENERFAEFFRPVPVAAETAKGTVAPLPDTGLDSGAAEPKPLPKEEQKGETQ